MDLKGATTIGLLNYFFWVRYEFANNVISWWPLYCWHYTLVTGTGLRKACWSAVILAKNAEWSHLLKMLPDHHCHPDVIAYLAYRNQKWASTDAQMHRFTKGDSCAGQKTKWVIIGSHHLQECWKSRHLLSPPCLHCCCCCCCWAANLPTTSQSFNMITEWNVKWSRRHNRAEMDTKLALWQESEQPSWAQSILCVSCSSRSSRLGCTTIDCITTWDLQFVSSMWLHSSLPWSSFDRKGRRNSADH